MHLLLFFVSRISVYTYLLQRVGLQSSDKYVHYYYGYGVAQGFVVELGIKMTPKHNFSTINGFVTLKLMGLEVLL